MKKIILLFSILFCVGQIVVAQSGGVFSITTSTIAGGSKKMSGGQFSVDVTGGNSTSGPPASGGIFSMVPGIPEISFAPTAVGVSGRILNNQGRGVRSARVTLTDQAGVTLQVFSGPNGVFRFDGVESGGRIYSITVLSRRFTFVPRDVTVAAQVTGIEIIGQTN